MLVYLQAKLWSVHKLKCFWNRCIEVYLSILKPDKVTHKYKVPFHPTDCKGFEDGWWGSKSQPKHAAQLRTTGDCSEREQLPAERPDEGAVAGYTVQSGKQGDTPSWVQMAALLFGITRLG